MVLVGLVVAVLFVFRFRPHTRTVAWADFKQRIVHGDFRTITVRDDGGDMELTGTLRAPPPQSVVTRVPSSTLDGTGWAALSELASKAHTDLSFEAHSWVPLP